MFSSIVIDKIAVSIKNVPKKSSQNPHTVRLFNATSCHYLISNLGLTGSVSLMM